MSNFCDNCGSKLFDEQNYCPNCGKAVKDLIKKSETNDVHLTNVILTNEKFIDKKSIKTIIGLLAIYSFILLLAAATFNAPIENSVHRDITWEDRANSVIYKTPLPRDLGELAQQEFTNVSFSYVWKSILYLVLIIFLSYTIKRNYMGSSQYKKYILYAIGIAGALYSIIVSIKSNFFGSYIDKYTFLIFMFYTVTIILNLLLFRSFKNHKYGIIVSLITSLIFVAVFNGAPSEDLELMLNIYAEFGKIPFYIVRFLLVASLISFTTLAYSYFSKRFIYIE